MVGVMLWEGERNKQDKEWAKSTVYNVYEVETVLTVMGCADIKQNIKHKS
jgi:hypothetical protein